MHRCYCVLFFLAVVWSPSCGPAVVRGNDARPAIAVMESLIGPEVLSDNLVVVRRVAAGLDVDARFDFLAAWVLPSTDHANVRLTGWFPSTQPKFVSPITNAANRLEADLPVSPAIDLLHAAVESKRTKELADRLSDLPEEDTSQQRAKQTMAFMLAIATEDEAETTRQLSALTSSVANRGSDDGRTWWPETTAAAFTMQQTEAPKGFEELIAQLYESRILKSNAVKNVAQDLFVSSLNTVFNPTTKQAATQRTGINPFSLWGASSVRTAKSEGRGYGTAKWTLRPQAIQKLAGHNRDALYFPAPLTGDFEVYCESTVHYHREMQLAYAGLSVEQRWQGDTAKLAQVTWDPDSISIQPTLTTMDAWLTRRIAVADGLCRHYLNGRLLYEYAMPQGHSPWLAIRADKLIRGSVRNLTIAGMPTIPAQVNLCNPPILNDWVAFFTDKGKWITYQDKTGTHILEGQPRPELTGTQAESLLLYHRPMMEDGEIEYEFYCEPGKQIVHPAMDRQAFLLNSNHVAVHDVTLGMYQRAEIDPNNLSNMKGDTEELSLLPNAWNHVRFQLSGDTIRIRLNDEDIFEGKINADALRQFGFFHYADRSQARIRNIRWTGDWQRYAASLNDIAGLPSEVAAIEAATAKLPQSFHHDFRGTELPEGVFTRAASSMKQTQRGLAFSATAGTSNGSWNQKGISVKAIAGGNFDLRASYRDIVTTGPGDAGVLFSAYTSQQIQGLSISRTHRGKTGDEKVKTQVMYENPDKTRRYEDGWFTFEAPTGTLRLVRLGTTLYFMIAESNSDVFRIIDTRTVNKHDLNYESIHLAVYAANDSEATGVWTDVSIRAERLTGPSIETID